MSWADIAGGQSVKVEPERRVKHLPMEMTAGEALEAWDAHWLRCTDPAHTWGEARELGAYRERFERLRVQEETGVPALPVELPRTEEASRPSHFTFSAKRGREGTHLACFQKAKLTRTWLRNQKAKGAMP